MKPIEKFNVSHSKFVAETNLFRDFLSSRASLDERKDIIPFFQQNKQLAGNVGSYIVKPDLMSLEYRLFGDFQIDLIVGDSSRSKFCLIEFEDAKSESIFRKAGRTVPEWAPRFEHGYSQLVDWFWTLRDQRQTEKFKSIFGSKEPTFIGILIIGRDQYLTDSQADRLKWRSNNVIVNSHRIECMTFDQLLRDLENKIV